MQLKTILFLLLLSTPFVLFCACGAPKLIAKDYNPLVEFADERPDPTTSSHIRFIATSQATRLLYALTDSRFCFFVGADDATNAACRYDAALKTAPEQTQHKIQEALHNLPHSIKKENLMRSIVKTASFRQSIDACTGRT